MIARQYFRPQTYPVRVSTRKSPRPSARQARSVEQVPWVRVLIGTALVLLLLFAYSCPVAQLTRIEYQKSQIQAQLNYLRTSNEILQAEVERLSSPALVRQYVEKEGMVLATSPQFAQLKIAQPTPPPPLEKEGRKTQQPLVGFIFGNP